MLELIYWPGAGIAALAILVWGCAWVLKEITKIE